MTKVLLQVFGLRKYFDGIRAVDDVSFEVETGSTVGIVGPNGSGKTSLLNLIGGYLKPTSGTISLGGERIDGLSPYLIARRGIGRTFQSVRVFRDMSLLENMAVPGIVRKNPRMETRTQDLLEFVGLQAYRDKLAGQLSYGQQRLLEFAVALMADPKAILLDEPIAGVNPVLIERLAELITDLKKAGTTFIIVEHNARFVTMLCDKVLVLDHGCKLAEGTPQEIRQDARVIEAFLGKGLNALRG